MADWLFSADDMARDATLDFVPDSWPLGDVGPLVTPTPPADDFYEIVEWKPLAADRVGEIVVIGKIDPYNHGAFQLLGNVDNYVYGYFEPADGSNFLNGADGDVHTIDTGDATMTPELEEAVEALAKLVATIDRAISTLSDTDVITLPDGRKVTGAEIKKIWASIDFEITDRSFGPGRAGATLDDGTLQVNAGFFTQYYTDNGQDGLEWDVFHEFAHLTTAADDFYNDAWFNYTESTPDTRQSEHHFTTTGWFRSSEMYANSLARDIGGHLGYHWGWDPPHGYRW